MFEPCQVLGVTVHSTSLTGLSERLNELVSERAPHQIVTVNVDFLRIASSNTEFRDCINHADLVLPDGLPVTWLAKLLGQPRLARITGLDLLDVAADLAARNGYRIFLLGAGPGIAAEAGRSLQMRHPGLHVAGSYSPPLRPFTRRDDEDAVERVRSAAPHMLFVGLGAPRQDLWIRDHLAALGVPVCAGVGGSFDLLSGRLSRAPVWLQRAGFEWAYRLKQEPVRLWRRYLAGDLPYLTKAVGAALVHQAKYRALGADRGSGSLWFRRTRPLGSSRDRR